MKTKRYHRFLSCALIVCLLMGSAPFAYADAGALKSLSLSLAQPFVEMSSTDGVQIALSGKDDAGEDVDLSAYEIQYQSSDESIASVTDAGVVIPHKMGRVTIMAETTSTGSAVRGELEIPIVGENLLIRDGKNHGRLEAGINSAETPWWPAYSKAFKATTTLETRASYIRNSAASIKVYYNKNAAAQRSAIYFNPDGTTAMRDFITIDPNKMYEFTGWLKYESITADPKIQVEQYFYPQVNSATTPGVVVPNQNYNTLKKVTGVSSGNSDWIYFNTVPVAKLHESVVGASPRILGGNATKGRAGGNVYAADMSYHEVVYDHAEITASTDLSALEIGSSFELTTTHFANSGSQIKPEKDISYSYVSTDPTGGDIPIDVTYTSSNPSVALVGEKSGVVSIVGSGDATVRATATIAGVTKTAELQLSIEGKAYGALDSIEVNAPDLTENTMLEAQKTQILVVARDKDQNVIDMAKEKATVSYESSAPAIASVSDSGEVEALTPGSVDINVQVTISGVTKSATLPLQIQKDPVTGIALKAEKQELLKGESTGFFLAASTQGGRTIELDATAAAYAKNPEGIVTVNPDERKITADHEGAAQLTATITLEDKEWTTPALSLRVKNTSPLSGISLTAETKNLSLMQTVQIAVAGKYEDGDDAILDDAEISYQVTGDAVTVSQTGLVTGEKVGSADVQVSATKNGKTVQETISFTVTDNLELTLTYDIKKCASAPMDTKYSDTDNMWEYYENGSGIDMTQNQIIRKANYGIQVQNKLAGPEVYIALKLNIPHAGYYQPTFVTAKSRLGGIVRAYLAPLDAEDHQAAKYSIGTADCYSEEFLMESENAMRMVYIPEPGEYIFSVQAIDKTINYNMYPGMLTLERIAYASEDADSVYPDFDISGMRPAQTEIDQYGEILIPASAVMKDGRNEDLCGAEIEAIVSDPDILEATVSHHEVSNRAQILLVGKKAGGPVTVQLRVTLDGKKQEISFTVKVNEIGGTAPSDIVLDFQKDTDGYTPHTVTIPTHGWNLNKTLTSPYLLGQSGTVWLVRFIKTYGIQVQSRLKDGQDTFAIDFEVKTPGNYQLQMSGGNFPAGGISSVYVDGQYAGEYDWYGAGVESGRHEELGSMYLEKGIHTLVMKTTGQNKDATSGAMYPGKITFAGMKSLPALSGLSAIAERESIAAGESTALTAVAEMENDYRWKLLPQWDGSADARYTLAFQSSNSAVATVDANGTIRGVSPGSANITVRLEMGEAVKEVVVPIEVNRNTFSSVSMQLQKEKLYENEKTAVMVTAKLSDDSMIAQKDLSISLSSSAPEILTVDGMNISAKAAGHAVLTAEVTFNNIKKQCTLDVEVLPTGLASIQIKSSKPVLSLTDPGAQLTVTGKINTGVNADLTNATITYASMDPSIVTVSATGFVTPVARGTTEIKVSVTLDGITVDGLLTISVGSSKKSPTVYTYEKRKNAQENAEKYNWARDMRDKAVKDADKIIRQADTLYDMIPGEGLPRSTQVGLKNDPSSYTCPYCETDLRAEYGSYAWLIDPIYEPWKIQCPQCRRKFPSNDFASYYEAGLDVHGKFNEALAKERGAEYLKNVLYPEKGEDWGVDDGWGYKTGNMATATVPEVKTYIAYYQHFGFWHKHSQGGVALIATSLNTLKNAYLYTGDNKYGRVGAILIDRIADVYPEYDLRPYAEIYANSDGGTGNGKILGSIWECALATTFVESYDAFWPAMEDPWVIDYLSQKAEQYQMSNPKTTAEAIRENGEDGILREVYRGVTTANINGNFGMLHRAVALAAVSLDTMPETGEWLSWMLQAGSVSSTANTGGNLLPQLVNRVDRDGFGDETGAGYNYSWLSNNVQVAELLNGYDKYPAADLYKNPKFVKMFTGPIVQIMARKYTAQIGDYGGTGKLAIQPNLSTTLLGYQSLGDPKLAQLAYFLNGNSVDGIHADIFTKDPEAVTAQIKAVIEEQGELAFPSENATGFGLAVLRSGDDYSTENRGGMDTQTDFWMYYGRNQTSHSHPDKLNLGIDAYGFNMAPELGYPEATGADPNRHQWIRNTISHNTVVVNERKQNSSPDATPMHFDGEGKVKVMDVDGSKAYSGVTSIYRRTVVMVEASDEVSYGVDFFRIKGGQDHTYSFHSQSDNITETEGLNLVRQEGGSYAGEDIPWGPNDSYLNGYTWLRNVRRDANPQSGNFSVNFKQTDFHDVLPYDMDLNLRMTMLNDFPLSEVSLVEGTPPRVAGNPPMLEFVLARRKGENLDTLFTTVFEPYKDDRYLQEMVSVPVSLVSGTEGADDTAKAICVTHTDGRRDYIVYATNNQVTYRVDNLFDFQGFVGVYTVKNGENTYSYINDGSQIGDMTTTPAYTGKVVNFTKEMSLRNTITVALDSDVDPQTLVGRYVYINNDGKQNGSYQIRDAALGNDGQIVLDIGDVSTIRQYKNNNDLNGGYIYNIGIGQTLRIPLSKQEDASPVFKDIPEQSCEAGSEVKLHIQAESPLDHTLQYAGVDLPRGAQFDSDTQTLSWIPDSAQVGRHYLAVSATDGVYTSVQHIAVVVYHSASGGGTGPINNTPGSSTTEKPAEPEKPVVTTEKDEVSFASSADETTAETKLGSVTFADGTFAADGQGKLKIERENETYTVSVTATGDMEQKPAKVSLNYTPADNMTDENCIIVKDENGNIIPNGRYENGKMTFYTDTFGKFTIEHNPKSFTDLGNHAWADEAVTRLAARGIINGITATTYGPAKNITRADFTTLIVRTFGFTAETASFADVPANAYYAEPVGIAKTLGIVGGVNETDFAPTSEITRQDMMVIVARALEKAGYVLDATENAEFSDMHEVADYAKDAVEILTRSGLIAGSNGKVNPKGNTTRAEVAVILDRILFMAR